LKTPALKQMLEGGPLPLLIDVASGEGHDSIQGATWLPGAGRGANFVDALQGQLADRLERITGGDKARSLVFFCVNAQCWLSYNAALRAAALGYANVYWYRGGIEAWRLAGLPLAKVQRATAPLAQ
jgi:PQQ-dependent catabolism-associated CXXCW motif protein